MHPLSASDGANIMAKALQCLPFHTASYLLCPCVSALVCTSTLSLLPCGSEFAWL